MRRLLEKRPAKAEPGETVERLKELIATLCPKAKVQVELGGEKAGNMWLDIEENEVRVTAEWRPNLGVGIFHPGTDAYGASPQEVFRDLPMAARRIKQLLKAKALDQPGLRALRKLFNFSQKEIARRLHIEQAAVSRLEGRKDVKMQSLVNVVRAMGGEVEIRVRFEGGEMPIFLPKNKKPSVSTKAARKRVHA